MHDLNPSGEPGPHGHKSPLHEAIAIHQEAHAAHGFPGAHHLEDLFNFRRLYFLVLKRLWIIAAVVMVGMIIVTAHVLGLPKIYESKAVLQVDLKEKKILSSDDAFQENSTTPDYLNTVSQAITSGNILLRVIKANHLDEDPEFAPPRLGGKKYSDDELIARLEKKISVNLRRQTRIIDIIAEDKIPVKARDLALSMEKEFFREAFEQRMSVNRIASEFLSEEADKLKVKLEESEQKLQHYKEDHKAVSLEQNQNIVQEKLHDINSAYTEAKNARLKLEADLEKLSKTDPSKTDQVLQIGSVASLKEITDLQSQLSAAESDLATMKEHYLEKHPKNIAAKNKIAGLKNELAQKTLTASATIRQQYDSTLQTERKMEESLREQEKNALELSKLAISYNVLLREVQTDQAMYDSVISRMKETRVEAGVESAPYRVIQEPILPSKPSKPKRAQILLVALILLTSLSVGAVIAFDISHPGVRTLDEAEQLFHIPVLGAIPDSRPTTPEKLSLQIAREKAILPERMMRAKMLVADTRKKKKLSRRQLRTLLRKAPKLAEEKAEEKESIALISDPSSPLSEAYRTLRASIDMLVPASDYQTILFTSAVPEEGKSFTSVHVAVSFAQQGLKTLIIDGDLRRPSLHHMIMEGVESAGFTDYLAGKKSLDEIIVPTNIDGLSIITAGSRVKNPAEILSRGDLQRMMAELKSRFDKIVIDSAPINAVSDTLYLAGVVKKVLLVIRAESTPRQVLTRSLKLITKTGASVCGLVLNRMSRGSSAGYYYYYYGDKYLKDSVYGTTEKGSTKAS